ncbi:MAG: sulfatase-like hydrolase/transferase, partial [Planctomycetes bacterium]|nr:sulfatase-like hydrolase/transferase [Planctomycetota bacterium]
LAENTVVLLISDHQSRGKWTIYERGVNTPFAVRWKGTVKQGQVCEQIVANIDVAPTVCDICGIKDKAADFDGISFKKQLLDSKRKGREWLALEMGYARGVVTKKYKYIALRYPKNIQDKITDENRKSYNWQGQRRINYNPDFPKNVVGHLPVYVKFPGYYDYDQLYDLEKDPMETVNLAADVAYESVLKKMKKKLREHIKSTGQRFGRI